MVCKHRYRNRKMSKHKDFLSLVGKDVHITCFQVAMFTCISAVFQVFNGLNIWRKKRIHHLIYNYADSSNITKQTEEKLNYSEKFVSFCRSTPRIPFVLALAAMARWSGIFALWWMQSISYAELGDWDTVRCFADNQVKTWAKHLGLLADEMCLAVNRHSRYALNELMLGR